MVGTFCPERTQRSAQLTLKGLIGPLFAIRFLPFHQAVFRATPSDQQGKGQGARESSLPSLELWGRLRFRPGSLDSHPRADISCLCDPDCSLPQFPHVVSGLTTEPGM